MTCGDNILDFTYDANGAPLTLVTGGKVYYYLTNLQGDVISVESSDGTPVASYCYDAWGKILSSSGDLAELTPLRYRGYVYDQETGFYYVESRYYDPAIGRFINADSYASTGAGVIGCNMFAYSNNNPVLYADPAGHSFILTCVIVGAAISAIAGSVVAAVVSKKKTGSWAVAGGAVAGGAVGALAGWGQAPQSLLLVLLQRQLLQVEQLLSLEMKYIKIGKVQNRVLEKPYTAWQTMDQEFFLRLWETGWWMLIIQRLILLRSRNMDIRRIRHS